MNAYYHSLIEEIKKEIDEKSYAQAYELICQELNMPYVPEDALELLEYYKSECKPYLEQKSKSMDFSKLQDYVHGTLEQKIYAISILENTNLRMCHDEVQELLDSDLPDEYKGTLIEALMEQKIDDPFDLIKSGLNITFIPSAILPMEQDQSINEASSLFESWFTNEDPTMIQFCMSLLMQLVLYERPFDQEDKDPYQLAKGICRLVYDTMQKENSTGELEVTVEGEAWKKAQKKALNYAKSHMNLKGFRQGQIPDALVKKQLSSKALYDMASEEVANEALSEGIKEHNIDLVARPTLDVKEADDEKAVLVFTCTVLPEVTLGEYKGLDIKKADVEVTEEDVENEVKRVQDRYADWVVREDDDAAQLGDQVVIDFVGTKDGVAFEGGSGENYPLELGSGSFIPGFEEQLVGVKKGEEKDVEVTFPENYQAAELAGQPATFHCTVHEVKYKDLPELNDELIKKLKIENVETVDAYKEKVKTDLTAQKEREAEENFTNELLGKVCDNANVEIPAVMIDAEVDRMYKEFEGRMQQSGFTAKQFLEATHQTEEAIRAQMSPEAAARVKTQLVLEAIVKAESIEASDEDVEKEFTTMSEMYNMEVEKIKSLISPESIKADLANQKALDFIKTSVK